MWRASMASAGQGFAVVDRVQYCAPRVSPENNLIVAERRLPPRVEEGAESCCACA